MAAKLPTQQEIKKLGDKAFQQLIAPKEDGGWGLTEDQAKDLMKDAGIYETATVYATASAPHHKEGEEIFGSKALADKMIAQGWATATKPAAKK
jgi:hypothetical protein